MPAGADLPIDRAAGDDIGLRGTNQSGMREQNERLVLSLVRQHGALAKSDIARITGLSAQTVSVIMRALERCPSHLMVHILLGLRLAAVLPI